MQRKEGLERFLHGLLNHPVFCVNTYLDTFLTESDGEQFALERYKLRVNGQFDRMYILDSDNAFVSDTPTDDSQNWKILSLID